MIVLTGATGKLGSRIVDQLLERLPATEVGVSVRDPEKAQALSARGVRVRRGDFDEPETFETAFEGATQVLIVSASATGDDAVAHHTSAIDAAVAAGARRVLYTSHQAAAANSLFAPMPDHAATTDYLATIGIPFTSLRHGFYASTVPLLVRGVLETGELRAPADGPVSWTTHDDLAEADAIILAGGTLADGTLDGVTPPLTASHAYDLDDVAGMLSRISGRSIRRIVQDDEEWVHSLVGRGVPEPQVRMLLGMFQAARKGEFDVTDPALEQLLGRPPQSLHTVLEAVVSEPMAA